jgi:glutamate 5-kinase
MTQRSRLSGIRRLVVKVGSALVTNDGRGLDRANIKSWVDQIAKIRRNHIDVVLVSSGAVAEGMKRLGWTARPSAVNELQAAAAVGQMGLVQAYESCFQTYDTRTAQVLLTHDDLSNRVRYLNSRSTLRVLLDLGVVPIVNENDTVVTDEIKFGDNDSLAALVANLIEADLLVILTDQGGLYERDPRAFPDAQLVAEAAVNDPRLDGMVAPVFGALGRGGMATKIRAARLAARSGAATAIAYGRESEVLCRLLTGEALGTLLVPGQSPLAARKRWLAGHLQVRGRLVLDDGAVRVLRESGKSLLAVGIRAVRGNFTRGEMVACVDAEGKEVARGLVNYSAVETTKIMGSPSDRIQSVLGYVDEPEVITRDNLVLI